MPDVLMLRDVARWPQRLLMTLVRVYRLLFSTWRGASCRFEPTCSAYALQALEQHGAGAGSYLTLCRIARCQPFCRGGCDPVPSLFSSRVFGRRKSAGPVSSASTAEPQP